MIDLPKVTVVYNICGISGNENIDYYIEAIVSILQQEGVDTSVVISGCWTSHHIKMQLMESFLDTVSYLWVEDILPVNVTFNLACLRDYEKFQEEYGEENEGFVYIDSGCKLPDKYTLAKMVNSFQNGPFAMVAAQTDTDSGFRSWLGVDRFESDHIIPLGRACNLHCQFFSLELFRQFGKRCIPDIFASEATESVFSFLCAAIQKKWVICGNTLVNHSHGMDGPSSGFGHRGWSHTFRGRPISMIVREKRAKLCGFGLEEGKNILVHDPAQYDENGFSINPDLKEFIKDNLFLPKDLLNYDGIRHSYLPQF